jgi:hypothetical protein
MQKRTRRLDKHKQMGPCIYNIRRDSIGRGEKRLGWPLLAYSMLIILYT